MNPTHDEGEQTRRDLLVETLGKAYGAEQNLARLLSQWLSTDEMTALTRWIVRARPEPTTEPAESAQASVPSQHEHRARMSAAAVLDALHRGEHGVAVLFSELLTEGELAGLHAYLLARRGDEPDESPAIPPESPDGEVDA